MKEEQSKMYNEAKKEIDKVKKDMGRIIKENEEAK